MRTSSLALAMCFAAAGANCWADETPQPQPLASGGAVAAMKANATLRPKLTISPTVSQTTAVRMPDGSLGMVCEQKRNPRSPATPVKSTAAERQQ
jgi:hypothetical protein